MAVKSRPSSSHMEGGGSKPHRLKSFVQKKSSFILPKRALHSLNNEHWESEVKDVEGFEVFADVTTPVGGEKEKNFRKDYANIALQPPDGVCVWGGGGRDMWVHRCVGVRGHVLVYSCFGHVIVVHGIIPSFPPSLPPLPSLSLSTPLPPLQQRIQHTVLTSSHSQTM